MALALYNNIRPKTARLPLCKLTLVLCIHNPVSCFLWVIWQVVVQELQGLTQQLTGLQHQLQDSTLEVHRLEEEAGALDHKAVQLQLELDQAQRAHSDAQRHLQVSISAILPRHSATVARHHLQVGMLDSLLCR